MEKSGNFFDWCVQLLNVDATTAKKQLDTLQKLLYKVANKLPLTGKLKQRQGRSSTDKLTFYNRGGCSSFSQHPDHCIKGISNLGICAHEISAGPSGAYWHHIREINKTE